MIQKEGPGMWLQVLAIVFSILISVGSGAYIIGAKISTVSTELRVHKEYTATRIQELVNFKDHGARCTAGDCDRLDQRLTAVEQWILEAPPDAFEKTIDEFKTFTLKVFSEIRTTTLALTVELTGLKVLLEQHMKETNGKEHGKVH